MTDKLHKVLSKDHKAGVIHGDIAQNKREQAIKKYRDDHFTVLIATDVAARGIDVNNIDCVINYDIPNDVETYLHRIGRTGRAGNKGTAVSFVTKPEMQFIRRCECETGKTISQIDPDGLKFNTKKAETGSEPADTDNMIGATPEIKVAEKKVHIPRAMPPSYGKGPNGMVSLKINLGKADNFGRLQIFDLVRDAASLKDASVGKIGLGHAASYVEVSYDHVNATLDAVTGRKHNGKRIFMSVAPKKAPFKNKVR
jgi:hypothetical protein